MEISRNLFDPYCFFKIKTVSNFGQAGRQTRISITHDYLLTKRPILIYTPDYETYKTRSKFIVDFKEAIPSQQIFGSKKLIEEMLIANSGNYCFEKYNSIRNLYHTYQDNNSSFRVYEEVKNISMT